ncbi:MAG: PhzF family phenazine biosynthesis protein, partial [Pseudomonadota bacterium]
PATGAAAAAFSGWLRDSGRLSGVIEIMQGEDMGAPSRITARSTPDIGAPIRVEGATRRIRCEPR